MIKLTPTSDEIESLKPYEKEVAFFAVPERFFWELSKISFYGERLKTLHVRGMIDEWMEDCKKNIKAWNTACKEISSSKKLKELLQVKIFLLKCNGTSWFWR